MQFCSGPPMQFLSGVDSRRRPAGRLQLATRGRREPAWSSQLLPKVNDELRPTRRTGRRTKPWTCAVESRRSCGAQREPVCRTCPAAWGLKSPLCNPMELKHKRSARANRKEAGLNEAALVGQAVRHSRMSTSIRDQHCKPTRNLFPYRCSSVRNDSSTILSSNWSAGSPTKLCMTSSLA